nr:thioesterase domain-containing protein [Streptomyces sp. SID3343]
MWFRSFEDRPYAAVALYAFPFAGSGAAVFRPWTRHLPPMVELRAVQLPGRQDRIAEPPVHDCATLVTGLADVVESRLDDRPFAFFGHSMGALLSFELARELRRRGSPTPIVLGLSGWPSPRGGLPRVRYGGLSDAEFLDTVRRLGGMPEDVLNAPDLLSLIMPTLRADFAVVESHSFRDELPLDIPLSVFGGVADPFVEEGGLQTWRRESSAEVTVRQYPGRHFYLMDHFASVVSAFVGDLRAALDERGARGASPGRATGGASWQ